MPSVIGVDLGGTKLLAGRVGADLAVEARVRRRVAGLPRAELLGVLREGPLPTVVAPGSLLPLARASEPRTRIVFGEVSG